MYEKGIPSLFDRMETFIEFSHLYGKERIIWRYDPILISDKMSLKDVLDNIRRVGDKLYDYTEKLVFSYLDVYPKLNLPDHMRAPTHIERKSIEETLLFLNKLWGIELATCAEVGVSKGISKNRCIDPVLIKRITGKDVVNTKDTSQRVLCGCAPSIDIGKYRTCKNGCIYCYAG
jgi:hypothetical protein